MLSIEIAFAQQTSSKLGLSSLNRNFAYVTIRSRGLGFYISDISSIILFTTNFIGGISSLTVRKTTSVSISK